MSVEVRNFLVYIKGKGSAEFEYKSNVVDIAQRGALYSVTYSNGRSCNYASTAVKYYPLRSTTEGVRIYIKDKLQASYDTVDDYGRYIICRGERYYTQPIEKSRDIEICKLKSDIRPLKSILDYFKEITAANIPLLDINIDTSNNTDANSKSAEMVKAALEDIDLQESRSALSNYMDKTLPPAVEVPQGILYPFGCNESQKRAVEAALTNRLSIIEGPPGTGKTQTILNIIANLVAQNKSVAVVSNNNSAVFNVQEKLVKDRYGFMLASLGNSDNKRAFFEQLKPAPFNPEFYMAEDKMTEAKVEMASLDATLSLCFANRNKLAKLKSLISDAKVEFEHLQQEQPISNEIKAQCDKDFHLKWSEAKALKLKKLTSSGKVSTWLKITLLLQYRYFKLKGIEERMDDLALYANHKFYELHITSLGKQITELELWLSENDEKQVLARYTELSKMLFNGVLFNRFATLEHIDFSIADYRRNFDEFIKRFPVITSTTHSLHTSAPKEFLFDYLIIDEASQVDIIKSSLCLSRAKSAVIVGDSMQLSHIVDAQSSEIANNLMEQYSIDEAYNYVGKSVLDSLKYIYGAKIPCTLLKEHYRCHPQIIGFCNKKYYNNELVVMTENENHPFKIIETNITGAQMNMNQRQVDETHRYIAENFANELSQVGVVSPYRDHANLLKCQLPKEVLADTIHKFQGGEKDTIIFNTVRGKVSTFLDNPNLINVAVSRAKNQFIVVKPVSMELPHGTNIGDLLRYICYVGDPKETVVKGSVCSVFDLLYKEYNRVFMAFMEKNKAIKGSAAEIILHNFLRDILSEPKYKSVDFVREYRLRDLVRDYSNLSEEEIDFVRKPSRLDFLLYNKIDKAPILAIEVDGRAYHDNTLQQERDSKKNRILECVQLPLLRLRTDGHSEQERIVEALDRAMGIEA